MTLYTINIVVEGTAKKRPAKLAIDESDTRTYIFRYIFTCICREREDIWMVFIHPYGGGCTEVGIMKSRTTRWASTGFETKPPQQWLWGLGSRDWARWAQSLWPPQRPMCPFECSSAGSNFAHHQLKVQGRWVLNGYYSLPPPQLAHLFSPRIWNQAISARWWAIPNRGHKVETPIHDNIREFVTWECKEHGVKSWMC